MSATATMHSEQVKVPQPTVASHVRDYLQRVRGGDIGSLPAILGLIVLCIFFGFMRPSFLTAGNFANLFTQGAAVTLIAMGLIFVLLLGEIDLSAGFASGVCASVLAVLLTERGWPWYGAVAAALITGAVIGITLGLLVAKVGIPSFVVTLAAFLAFQGIALIILKEGKNISIQDDVILAVAFNGYVPPWLGWLLVALAVVGFAAAQLLQRRSRARHGLVTDPMAIIAARIVGIALILGAGVAVLNEERSRNPALNSLRGMPVVIVVIGVLLVVLTFVLRRTAYGRHLYAVGGSAEAARRAGINVDRIRISVFVIGSTMAAIGGIVAASRAASVDPNTGGSRVLLYAVGAAVIGGTSLFGGKGRVLDAVLGGAVIAVIDNGMGLMSLSSGEKYVFTGLVLLIAATVDALSRRRAAATGVR
jgi:D-xylose transport system permease protein